MKIGVSFSIKKKIKVHISKINPKAMNQEIIHKVMDLATPQFLSFAFSFCKVYHASDLCNNNNMENHIFRF